MISNNVLYEPLPEEWEGYKVNTWFQIGIQVFLIFDDDCLFAYEKEEVIKSLMFSDDNGEIREHPEGEEFIKCLGWFLNGWSNDNPAKRVGKKKVLDYERDQWRIYADFRQIYGINLNEAELHWWEFCALLWNMPAEYSSFLQVVEIRKKEITTSMSKKEREFYKNAQTVYALEQPEKEYTKEEETKIDEFDAMMRARKGK